MNTPPIVSPQEWEAAREQLLVKEKELTRARDALAAERRRMPWRPSRRNTVRRPGRSGEPARPVRRPPPADRLPRSSSSPASRRLARAAAAPVARSVPTRWPTWRTSTPATPRSSTCRARRRRTSSACGRGWAGTDPVVHTHRRLRRRLRRRRVARHQRVHPRRRRRLPHLLHQQPRRRGDGHDVGLPRHHRARSPGGVGGLAGGLPADAAVPVVDLHDEYPGGVIAHIAGVPIEEMLPVAGGGGAAACSWRAPGSRCGSGAGGSDERRRCAWSARSRRPPRPCSTRGPARRSCAAGGTPDTTGRPPRPPSTRGSAVRSGWSCATRTTDTTYGGGGVYTEVDPPRRLAFTWLWDSDPTTRQLIEIDFEEHEGVTTVRFTHRDLWDEEAVRSHEGGWGWSASTTWSEHSPVSAG